MATPPDLRFETAFFEGIVAKHARYQEALELLGGLYTQLGRVDEGLKIDQKLVRMDPTSPEAHYNLACSLALKNRKQDCYVALVQALELGYRDLDWLLSDPDLRTMQDYAPFEKLIKTLRKQAQAEEL